jgi:hypothetical protein
MRDADLRRAVLQSLADQHRDDPNTVIVQEMGIWAGSVRVDVAVINGELCGVELKSNRDTLQRLPGQADLYNQVFDRVTLVMGERHVPAACKLIPAWWGVMIAKMDAVGTANLTPMRAAGANMTLDPLQVARLLWRSEALAVLIRYGIDRGCRSRPVEFIAKKLSLELPLNVLRDEVRAALKARSSWLRKPIGDESEMALYS